MILWVVDSFILWRSLKKKLIAKFGEVQPGSGMYAFNRDDDSSYAPPGSDGEVRRVPALSRLCLIGAGRGPEGSGLSLFLFLFYVLAVRSHMFSRSYFFEGFPYSLQFEW